MCPFQLVYLRRWLVFLLPAAIYKYLLKVIKLILRNQSINPFFLDNMITLVCTRIINDTSYWSKLHGHFCSPILG